MSAAEDITWDSLDRLVEDDPLRLRDLAWQLVEEVRLRTNERREVEARVRALHEPMETDRYPVCFHCIGNEPWPCPTIRALEGDE